MASVPPPGRLRVTDFEFLFMSRTNLYLARTYLQLEYRYAFAGHTFYSFTQFDEIAVFYQVCGHCWTPAFQFVRRAAVFTGEQTIRFGQQLYHKRVLWRKTHRECFSGKNI